MGRPNFKRNNKQASNISDKDTIHTFAAQKDLIINFIRILPSTNLLIMLKLNFDVFVRTFKKNRKTRKYR